MEGQQAPPSRPVFRGTSLDSPVTKVGLPLIAVQLAVTGQLPGSACLVAPWFAMTARHVIEDFAPAQPGAEHLICTQVVTDQGMTVLPLFVHRIYHAQPYDIAVATRHWFCSDWSGSALVRPG
jgi:hypothetical protein